MMNGELLNLPWQIQISLASGYAAYVIAYIGMRERHKTIDTAFITLAFGLIATGILYLLREQSPIVAGGVALVAACISGIGWRKFGTTQIRRLLRVINMSWMDDDPSALATLSSNTKYRVTQISVQLDDGTWLRCDDVTQFHGAPFHPFLLGPNGDVALYLTQEDPPTGNEKIQKNVLDSHFGYRITYVPASRIRCLNIRHKP